MKIYIVVKNGFHGHIDFIESVWRHKGMAQEALKEHAGAAMLSEGYYQIITREVNRMNRESDEF